MQTGHEFTLCEEAALVYKNPFLQQDERLDALNEIARFLRLPENSSLQFPTYRNCIDGTTDSGEKITADELAAQIEAHIKSEMEIESALFRNDGIYEVTYFVKKESLRGMPYNSFFRTGFSCMENAIDFAKSDAAENLLTFEITLRTIDKPDEYVSGTFNNSGELLRVDSSFIGAEVF